MLCRTYHASNRQKRNITFLTEQLSLSVDNGLPVFPKPPVSGSSGITDRKGCIVIHGKFHHSAQLPEIFRSHYRHIGDGGQIGIIKDSLVGLSVASHQSCPVYGKKDRKILDTYVMKHLIVSSLQKGGIDCHHRTQARSRHARSACHCMSLRNSHIKKAVRKLFSKSCKSRTVRHSRCHGYQLWMGFPKLAQLSGKYLCIGGFLLFPIFFSRCNIKRTHTVKYGRILLRRFISLSLFCDHMDQNCVV